MLSLKYLSIAGFGITGVFFRYFIGLWASRYLSASYPYGTFLINLLGSFAIGVVFTLGAQSLISENLRVGIMVGLLGGFTTFSSYCLETFLLLEKGNYSSAIFYFFLSPSLGLGAAALGAFFARFIF